MSTTTTLPASLKHLDIEELTAALALTNGMAEIWLDRSVHGTWSAFRAEPDESQTGYTALKLRLAVDPRTDTFADRDTATIDIFLMDEFDRDAAALREAYLQGIADGLRRVAHDWQTMADAIRPPKQGGTMAALVELVDGRPAKVIRTGLQDILESDLDMAPAGLRERLAVIPSVAVRI